MLDACINRIEKEYNLENKDNLIILIVNVSNKIGFEIYAKINDANILSKLDINICNLTNNEISKCNNYSIDSFKEDLCITCHNNYYPIYNDALNKNTFVKCYKSPKGYDLLHFISQ